MNDPDHITVDLASVPLVGFTDPSRIDAFLGSASFIDSGEFLLTADHVIRGWGARIGFTVPLDPPWMYEAEVVVGNEDLDLALLRADGYRPEHPFPLADPGSIICNSFVACHEHGTTESVGDQLRIGPSNRLGNVTRILDLRHQYGTAGDDMLELSFPALRGASGAPVVHWVPPFQLIGVVVANVNHHLLPAQLVTVLDEKNEILEETQFMLPQALAVNVKHVRGLIEKQKR